MCVCVCMCVCVYVCMCVSVYVCVYVCVCLCVCVCMCVCVYACMCVFMCVYVCVWVYACICVCMFVYVCMGVCVCEGAANIDTGPTASSCGFASNFRLASAIGGGICQRGCMGVWVYACRRVRWGYSRDKHESVCGGGYYLSRPRHLATRS